MTRLPIALLVFACALAGCSGLTPPTFTVTDVRLTSETSEAIAFDLTIQGENTNDEELPLENVSYSFSLDGVGSYRGKRNAQATLPAGATQSFTIPVAIPVESAPIPDGERRYAFSGRVTYIIPGAIAEILFDSGVRRPTAGVSESGRLVFRGGTSENISEPQSRELDDQ